MRACFVFLLTFCWNSIQCAICIRNSTLVMFFFSFLSYRTSLNVQRRTIKRNAKSKQTTIKHNKQEQLHQSQEATINVEVAGARANGYSCNIIFIYNISLRLRLFMCTVYALRYYAPRMHFWCIFKSQQLPLLHYAHNNLSANTNINCVLALSLSPYSFSAYRSDGQVEMGTCQRKTKSKQKINHN